MLSNINRSNILNRQAYQGYSDLKNFITKNNARSTLLGRMNSGTRNLINVSMTRPMGKISTNLRKVATNPNVLSFAKKGLKGGAIVGGTGIGLGVAAIGIASGISSWARNIRQPPVVHTSRIRNTGQTNTYFNMGADPFSGVRFGGRRRNFM